jgi:hypothetical protein
MRTFLRSKATLLFLALGLLLAVPAVALANDVINADLIDNPSQVSSYTAGDSNGVRAYYWVEADGDGCDPADTGPLSFKLRARQGTTDFTSSFKARLSTASAGSEQTLDNFTLTFDGCAPRPTQSDQHPSSGQVKEVIFTSAANLAAAQYKIDVDQPTIADTNDPASEYSPDDRNSFLINVSASTGGGGGGTCTAPDTPVFATTSADANGSNGWFTTVPTVSASSATAGATIDYATEVNGGPKSASYSATAPVLGEGITTVYARATSGTCSSETTETFKVDTRKPDLNISGAADGTSYDVCAMLNGNSPGPQRPTFAPTDPTPGSGVTWVDANTNGKVDAAEFNTNTLDSWTTPSNAYGTGPYTYSAKADDNAGNVQMGGRSYSVLYGDAANGGAFSGFLPPINANGTRSVFKLTSTIPVKFQLTCNGAPLSNAVAYLTVQKVDSTPDGNINEAIATDAATTGNQFRYADGGYHFNLSTKNGYTNPSGQNVSFSAGTWRLIVSLDDQSTRSVVIDLRK